MLTAKSNKNFRSPAPNFGGFRGLGVRRLEKVVYCKRHICTSFKQFCVKIGWGSHLQEAGRKKESRETVYFTYSPKKPRWPDCHQIWFGANFVCITNCAKFRFNPFTGFDFVEGRNLAFPVRRNEVSPLTEGLNYRSACDYRLIYISLHCVEWVCEQWNNYVLRRWLKTDSDNADVTSGSSSIPYVATENWKVRSPVCDCDTIVLDDWLKPTWKPKADSGNAKPILFVLQGVSITCCADPVLATIELSVVCSSVCLSVTRWHCVKTTQARITKSSLMDSSRTLFSGKQFVQKFERVHPRRVRVGVGKICNFQPINRRISETVPDRTNVTIND